jgi:hypothetical protein
MQATKPKAAPPGAEEALRTAARDSGQSVYRLAKGSGIAQPVLHRFLNRVHGLTLRNAGKLMEHLGLAIGPQREKVPRRSRH